MRAKKPRQHGGRRPGAGRRASDPSGAKVKTTLWLAPAERAYLERLAGTVPDGLRRLIGESMTRAAT